MKNKLTDAGPDGKEFFTVGCRAGAASIVRAKPIRDTESYYGEGKSKYASA